MKLEAPACCDRPTTVDAAKATTRCRNCGMRRGVPERPDLSKLEGVSPRALRAVEALILLGGKAGVKAVAGRANMTPREAGHLLASAGCQLVASLAPHGRIVKQWTLPAGVRA